jgi:hypothetical protein
MKINKTILKSIIREALDSGEYDSFFLNENPAINKSAADLSSRVLDKLQRVAGPEIKQTDDVGEILSLFVELLNLIRQENPEDFTSSELGRLATVLKNEVIPDMQKMASASNVDDQEPAVPGAPV